MQQNWTFIINVCKKIIEIVARSFYLKKIIEIIFYEHLLDIELNDISI